MPVTRQALWVAWLIVLSGAPPAAPARALLRSSSQVGADDLQEIQSPLPYPYSAIGLLVFDGGESSSAPSPAAAAAAAADMSICTGFLISPDTVLTAAHCLYTVPNELRPDRPRGYRSALGFLPSYSRAANGSGVAPLGRVGVSWARVAPEWVDYAQDNTFYWRGDLGAVRLDRKIGDVTGWFGLAHGCDVASAALRSRTGKESARSGAGAGAAAAAFSTAAAVAGFPGSSRVASARDSSKLLFPLMGDRTCRLTGADVCPADASQPDRLAGMIRHRCDTSKGMSGSPIWLPGSTPAALAAAAGLEGKAGGWAGGGQDPQQQQQQQQQAATVVGVVSRSTGDCPWGPDCANLAAPINERAMELIRDWLSRP